MSEKLQAIYRALRDAIPELKRGVVWCIHCKKRRTVDAAQCLEHGWPKCCGYTMTVDSPEERGALRHRAPNAATPENLGGRVP